MIPLTVHRERLVICKACEFFSGVCLKGHVHSSPTGCPVKKFEPINGAAVMPDVEVKPPVKATGCCGGEKPVVPDVAPMSWADVLVEFGKSMVEWGIKGMPLVSAAEHERRYRICAGCEYFKYFQCRKCKCVCWVKAKLGTESCPDVPKRW